MRHLINKNRKQTVEIEGGEVVLRQLTVENMLVLDELRRDEAPAGDSAVAIIRMGVEGDFSVEDVKSLSWADYNAVLDAVQEHNPEVFPKDEKDSEDDEGDQPGNV